MVCIAALHPLAGRYAAEYFRTLREVNARTQAAIMAANRAADEAATGSGGGGDAKSIAELTSTYSPFRQRTSSECCSMHSENECLVCFVGGAHC